jgi:two-component system cell cycle sensor histidine kinase/response regulator CckA
MFIGADDCWSDTCRAIPGATLAPKFRYMQGGISSVRIMTTHKEPPEHPRAKRPDSHRASIRRIEGQQWWLASSGIAVTLLLTIGIVSFSLSVLNPRLSPLNSLNTDLSVRALVGMVLLFDVYVVFQQWQIYRVRVRLAHNEELFSLISENAADMIAVVSMDGHRLYNSPSYLRVLGYCPEELERTSAFEQIHPEDREKVKRAAAEARRSGIGSRVEYRMRHKDGHWCTLESTASVVRNEEGEVEKLVIVNRDITERKQLEQQLYLSQKLEAIGRLSGGVAHDFNNLLGVIIGYGEALQQGISDNSAIREAVDEILKAGHRAAGLTQQLLAFSRKQVLEPKVIDLNDVVGEVEKMLRRLIGEDVDLTITQAEGLGMVMADRGQIEQVILNLVVNSRDAMPQGGKLKIETANCLLDESDVDRYHYVVPGPYVLMKVSDTGSGMDAETKSHIFEPFYTTKDQGKGTGLGLATVYGVIKQSGGFIWVDSEPGQGAAFRIYLPRVVGEPVRSTESRAPVSRDQGSRLVLLVEDEPSLRKLTRTTLKNLGYTVLEAANASEALTTARQCASRIDLLLTDVVMPGMSGAELAQKLSPLRPEMRVLFMSGYTDGAIATHGVFESGISLLRKPFTREQLTRSLQEAFAVGARG